MINPQLLNPQSIVVVGASNDTTKPGGKILKNLKEGSFQGKLYVSNLKEDEVQGIKSYKNLNDLPDVDLAVMAIAAKYIPDTADFLTKNKNTKAFIVISAGFSEESSEGKIIEDKLVEIVNSVDGALIGPNCTGILTPNHQSIFTLPIPKLDEKGCTLISGSGATACFILESGLPKGLTFSAVYSVGNSAQMGVEEVVMHLDQTYDPGRSSNVILLYIENIDKPQMLLKHSTSLIRKGCKIAAVKAGSSEAGSRAASSHTGALASSDVAVQALFRKAGIVRCHGREDLINVGSVFMHPELKGKNIAIITHAGGPAVMLTDALSSGGLNIPAIEGPHAEALKNELFPGSSVSNPIDFLATGTAEQLGKIIDYTDQKFDNIDAMVVIFGTPGLIPVYDAYRVLNEKMKTSKKPIFPVLPSTFTAKEEVAEFLDKGRINFPDEVLLGRALGSIINTAPPYYDENALPEIDHNAIREIIDSSEGGYLLPEKIQGLLDAAGIPRAKELVVHSESDAVREASEIGFPVVMKVVGPLHKSDVGAVSLSIPNEKKVASEYHRLMKVKDAQGILIQPMLSGRELFVGAIREKKFGHTIMCGLGGIFIEVVKDVQAAISPVDKKEALDMIHSLRSYKIFEGVRGQKGINEQRYAEIITRVSALLDAAPEINEMDLNPLMGNDKDVIAVDARISIEKHK